MPLGVEQAGLPAGALLAAYRARGAFTDCYATGTDGAVTLERYVAAFYTTLPFRAERLMLRLALSLPSTDTQAAEFAAGRLDRFAAWRVEERRADQLLLADVQGRTRSWLMVVPGVEAGRPRTRLYFGSAIVPEMDRATGRREMGTVFRALRGFHHHYSMLLLATARRRITAGRG
jgi:hypothetical protein